MLHMNVQNVIGNILELDKNIILGGTMNKIGLEVGNLVLANGNRGTVLQVDINKAFIEVDVLIDNKKRIVKQWFGNDALKYIGPDKNIKKAETKKIVVEQKEEEITPSVSLELGVPDENEEKVEIKKRNKKIK